MSITIVKSGLFTSIQDMGRHGYQHLGINPGGAMDIPALQTANLLVQNNYNEAVIEFYFPAPQIKFNQSAFIALSGANFGAEINGTQIPINHPVYIAAGSTLQFKQKISGQIGYLAVQGGFVLNEWLNSNSTNTKAGAGGFEGRTLKNNDTIAQQQHTYNFDNNNQIFILPWMAVTKPFYNNTPFHIIAGNEFKCLTPDSQQILTQQNFTISPQSDRMGCRLNGPALSLQQPVEMISTAVTRGTIQLLPNGQCMVLLADHQTTGGYPRIGHICSSAFASLAQKSTGEKVSFLLVDGETAEKNLHYQAQHLKQLTNACTLQLNAYNRY